MSEIPEEIRKMFPDQPIHKLDIDDSGELHILASAEPLNDPEFENMPIEQVNQYLREHGYDPEQVGIHGKFLQELLKRISTLEADKLAAESKQREADLMVERLIEAGDKMADELHSVRTRTI